MRLDFFLIDFILNFAREMNVADVAIFFGSNTDFVVMERLGPTSFGFYEAFVFMNLVRFYQVLAEIYSYILIVKGSIATMFFGTKLWMNISAYMGTSWTLTGLQFGAIFLEGLFQAFQFVEVIPLWATPLAACDRWPLDAEGWGTAVEFWWGKDTGGYLCQFFSAAFITFYKLPAEIYSYILIVKGNIATMFFGTKLWMNISAYMGTSWTLTGLQFGAIFLEGLFQAFQFVEVIPLWATPLAACDRWPLDAEGWGTAVEFWWGKDTGGYLCQLISLYRGQSFWVFWPILVFSEGLFDSLQFAELCSYIYYPVFWETIYIEVEGDVNGYWYLKIQDFFLSFDDNIARIAMSERPLFLQRADFICRFSLALCQNFQFIETPGFFYLDAPEGFIHKWEEQLASDNLLPGWWRFSVWLIKGLAYYPIATYHFFKFIFFYVVDSCFDVVVQFLDFVSKNFPNHQFPVFCFFFLLFLSALLAISASFDSFFYLGELIGELWDRLTFWVYLALKHLSWWHGRVNSFDLESQPYARTSRFYVVQAKAAFFRNVFPSRKERTFQLLNRLIVLRCLRMVYFFFYFLLIFLRKYLVYFIFRSNFSSFLVPLVGLIFFFLFFLKEKFVSPIYHFAWFIFADLRNAVLQLSQTEWLFSFATTFLGWRTRPWKYGEMEDYLAGELLPTSPLKINYSSFKHHPYTSYLRPMDYDLKIRPDSYQANIGFFKNLLRCLFCFSYYFSLWLSYFVVVLARTTSRVVYLFQIALRVTFINAFLSLGGLTAWQWTKKRLIKICGFFFGLVKVIGIIICGSVIRFRRLGYALACFFYDLLLGLFFFFWKFCCFIVKVFKYTLWLAFRGRFLVFVFLLFMFLGPVQFGHLFWGWFGTVMGFWFDILVLPILDYDPAAMVLKAHTDLIIQGRRYIYAAVYWDHAFMEFMDGYFSKLSWLYKFTAIDIFWKFYSTKSSYEFWAWCLTYRVLIKANLYWNLGSLFFFWACHFIFIDLPIEWVTYLGGHVLGINIFPTLDRLSVFFSSAWGLLESFYVFAWNGSSALLSYLIAFLTPYVLWELDLLCKLCLPFPVFREIVLIFKVYGFGSILHCFFFYAFFDFFDGFLNNYYWVKHAFFQIFLRSLGKTQFYLALYFDYIEIFLKLYNFLLGFFSPITLIFAEPWDVRTGFYWFYFFWVKAHNFWDTFCIAFKVKSLKLDSFSEDIINSMVIEDEFITRAVRSNQFRSTFHALRDFKRGGAHDLHFIGSNSMDFVMFRRSAAGTGWHFFRLSVLSIWLSFFFCIFFFRGFRCVFLRTFLHFGSSDFHWTKFRDLRVTELFEPLVDVPKDVAAFLNSQYDRVKTFEGFEVKRREPVRDHAAVPAWVLEGYKGNNLGGFVKYEIAKKKRLTERIALYKGFSSWKGAWGSERHFLMHFAGLFRPNEMIGVGKERVLGHGVDYESLFDGLTKGLSLLGKRVFKADLVIYMNELNFDFLYFYVNPKYKRYEQAFQDSVRFPVFMAYAFSRLKSLALTHYHQDTQGWAAVVQLSDTLNGIAKEKKWFSVAVFDYFYKLDRDICGFRLPYWAAHRDNNPDLLTEKILRTKPRRDGFRDQEETIYTADPLRHIMFENLYYWGFVFLCSISFFLTISGLPCLAQAYFSYEIRSWLFYVIFPVLSERIHWLWDYVPGYGFPYLVVMDENVNTPRWIGQFRYHGDFHEFSKRLVYGHSRDIQYVEHNLDTRDWGKFDFLFTHTPFKKGPENFPGLTHLEIKLLPDFINWGWDLIGPRVGELGDFDIFHSTSFYKWLEFSFYGLIFLALVRGYLKSQKAKLVLRARRWRKLSFRQLYNLRLFYENKANIRVKILWYPNKRKESTIKAKKASWYRR